MSKPNPVSDFLKIVNSDKSKYARRPKNEPEVEQTQESEFWNTDGSILGQPITKPMARFEALRESVKPTKVANEWIDEFTESSMESSSNIATNRIGMIRQHLTPPTITNDIIMDSNFDDSSLNEMNIDDARNDDSTNYTIDEFILDTLGPKELFNVARTSPQLLKIVLDSNKRKLKLNKYIEKYWIETFSNLPRITNDQMDTIKWILDNNAVDPNIKDQNGSTALVSAAAKHNETLVKILLDEGADPDIKDRYGVTPLIWASRRIGLKPMGNEKIVKMLLDKGADPNIKETYGQTALIWASQSKENEKIVKMLLDRGADPNIISNQTYSALHKATMAGHENILKLLLDKGADPEIKDKYSDTPLIKASSYGDEKIVKLLLERGADPKIENNEGENALSWASKKGYENIVNMLNKAMKAGVRVPNSRL
jgi:ankyrin repeat protein